MNCDTGAMTDIFIDFYFIQLCYFALICHFYIRQSFKPRIGFLFCNCSYFLLFLMSNMWNMTKRTMNKYIDRTTCIFKLLCYKCFEFYIILQIIRTLFSNHAPNLDIAAAATLYLLFHIFIVLLCLAINVNTLICVS